MSDEPQAAAPAAQRITQGAIAAMWWRDHLADRERGSARALSARLRRADGITALAEPQVVALARRLRLGPPQAATIVRLVTVLADLRESDPQPLAARLGGPEPALSTLRFQRLLRSEGDDLTRQLRRALPMAGRRCDVERLAGDLLFWEHPEHGDRIRARWSFDYFGAAPPEALQGAATPSEEISR